MESVFSSPLHLFAQVFHKYLHDNYLTTMLQTTQDLYNMEDIFWTANSEHIFEIAPG